MGVPGNANALLLRSAAAAGGYQVSRSLRFNSSDSAFCSRSVSSAGSRTTWTWAGWVKKCRNGAYQSLFTSSRSGFETLLLFDNSDRLYLYNFVSGSFAGRKLSTSVFRDPSAWYHVVAVWDSTNATAADRCRLYVNGVRLTAFDTSTDPGPSEQTQLNDAYDHQIGNYVFGGSSYYLNGYLADIHFIDGQALTPSSFTEVSATTGQLIPKAYSGSFGTNGFWLKFSDNSAATATTLGKDYSGNNNNWTPNNLSVTAGSGNDSLVDTPTSSGTDTGLGGQVTGNYATLNPLKMGSFTLSNGNLDCVSTSSYGLVLGTIGMSSGKWYFETTLNGSGAANSIGIATDAVTITQYPGYDSLSWVYLADGRKINGGSRTSYGASFTTGDVIGVAFDADAGSLTFYKNGSSQGTAFTGLTSGPYFPVVGDDSSGSQAEQSLNFGQRQWAYAAPAGFKALCDTNLPAPVVAKPNTVMDVKLYTGNGGTQTISGLGFSPDFIWTKSRSRIDNNVLHDIVRGRTSNLYSDLVNSENTTTTSTADLVSFDANGYTLGTVQQSAMNRSGETYVAWTWDAGTSTVTNTQGSITTSVRANPSAGFSVVTGTTPATNTFTIGHGLNAEPHFIIVKVRNQAYNWDVYHKSLGNTGRLVLNLTNASSTFANVWGSTTPTSSVFTMGGNGTWYNNGDTFVAYVFSPVAGYSSAFSYSGSGSSDGPAVWLGFRPRLILIKRSDSTASWQLYDTARGTYNVVTQTLAANESTAESGFTSGYDLDILSTGFKIRAATSNAINSSGGTYIGFAWAESPFQYARAR